MAECAAFAPAKNAPAGVSKAVAELSEVLRARVEQLSLPAITTAIKGMPEALDQSVYQHERWPVVVDPSGHGVRFLKYQRGTFVLVQNPLDMDKENLRRALVGALQHGAWLILHFDDMEDMTIEKYFDDRHFPRAALRRGEVFRESTYSALLRPDKGDPPPELFRPRDDFKVIAVTRNAELGRRFALEHGLCVVTVLDPSESAPAGKKGQSGDALAQDEIAQAFGARDTKRNSTKLVEAAFDDEWSVIQDQIDKGYSIESADAHGHTALSEAACQGNLEVMGKLLALGAEPNVQNDAGRSCLYRAAYNGHLEACRVLLAQGADPRLKAGMETPFDVAKTEEVRALLSGWDVAETDRLVARRKAEADRRAEERLSTAAERDAFAREKIRQELVDLAAGNKARELKDRLQELADEAAQHNERPRGSAEVRDERGNTLLLLACWKGHVEVCEMLLTHFETLDPEMDKVERKTFFASVKARDSKGWNCASLATFHGHKKLLELVLAHGADPYVKTSYNKNAFDLAQDDLDAARAVVLDKSEIRNVLLAWEREQNPKAAEERAREPMAQAFTKEELQQENDLQPVLDPEDGDKRAKGGKKSPTGKAGKASPKPKQEKHDEAAAKEAAKPGDKDKSSPKGASPKASPKSAKA